jgi:hypothetical protein
MSTSNRSTAGGAAVLDFVDPDIASVVSFLAGELSPAEAAAFDERLVDEPAFFEKVFPLMVLHVTPIDFDAVERLAAEREQKGLEPSAIELESEPAATALNTAPSTAAPSSVRPLSVPAKPRRSGSWYAKWSAGITMAAASIAVIAVGFDPAVRQMAAKDALAKATMVAASGGPKTMELANASVVSLRPNASIILPPAQADDGLFKGVGNWVTEKNLVVYLAGSASFDMTRAVSPIELITPAGRVTLYPDGIYEVTYDQSIGRSSVFVRAGRATLEPVSGSSPQTVGVGQQGTLVNPAQPAGSSNLSPHNGVSR